MKPVLTKLRFATFPAASALGLVREPRFCLTHCGLVMVLDPRFGGREIAKAVAGAGSSLLLAKAGTALTLLTPLAVPAAGLGLGIVVYKFLDANNKQEKRSG